MAGGEDTDLSFILLSTAKEDTFFADSLSDGESLYPGVHAVTSGGNPDLSFILGGTHLRVSGKHKAPDVSSTNLIT